jgi:hypothetical protein
VDKLELKRGLLQKCLSIQQKSAENLLSVMQEAQQSANDYGQPKDRYDSYRTQLLRKRDMFGGQLKKVDDEITLLDRIDLKQLNKNVSFGAVVVTNAQRVFVSVGIGKLEFNNEVYYAISPLVPFYKAMEGMKKGDVFNFRGKDITILDLF